MEKARYMVLMDEFIEKIDYEEEQDEETCLNRLYELKELINDISNEVKETNMFARAKEQYSQFKLYLEENSDTNRKLVINSYVHLLERIANSPTSLHMRGAIILCMPLLADALNKGK